MSIIPTPPTTNPKTAQLVQTIFFVVVSIISLIFWGWDWREILILFWFGNISAGIIAIVKYLLIPAAKMYPRSKIIGHILKIYQIFIFIIAYGIYITAHGAIVLVLAYNSIDFPFIDTPATPLFLTPILIAWPINLIYQIITIISETDTTKLSAQSIEQALGPVFIRQIPLVALTLIVAPVLLSGIPNAVPLLLIAFYALINLYQAGIFNRSQKLTSTQ